MIIANFADSTGVEFALEENQVLFLHLNKMSRRFTSLILLTTSVAIVNSHAYILCFYVTPHTINSLFYSLLYQT